jgi:Lrp/AsnC family leucine-responsive transcriptional regulator
LLLDDLDRALLATLTKHARLSNRKLAGRVGLSPSACLARVRKLERSGIIVGYRAIISPSGAGEHLEGWADVRLIDPQPEALVHFIELVKSIPEIVEAHRIAGQYDFAVRFSSGDLDAWNRFRRELDALGCASHTRFNILLEPLK